MLSFCFTTWLHYHYSTGLGRVRECVQRASNAKGGVACQAMKGGKRSEKNGTCAREASKGHGDDTGEAAREEGVRGGYAADAAVAVGRRGRCVLGGACGARTTAGCVRRDA